MQYILHLHSVYAYYTQFSNIYPRMKYLITLLSALLLVTTACKKEKTAITSLDMLKGGKTFAVPIGTTADKITLKSFPDAKFQYYQTIHDCALAVERGKADAAIYDLPVLQFLASKNNDLNVIEELLTPDDYGFAVKLGNDSLKRAIDNTVHKLKSSGLYDEMISKWITSGNKDVDLPEPASDGTNGILTFGTAAATEPISFVKNNKIIGFDIELAQHVADYLNKELKVINMDFGGMLPALISGKVDMIGSGLSITEERAKSVLFSKSYYKSGIAALVKAQNSANSEKTDKSQDIKTIESIGVLTGSVHEPYAIKNYPDADIRTYNAVSDMLMALTSEKIQTAFVDKATYLVLKEQNDEFSIFQDSIFSVGMGVAFHKSDTALLANFNRFLSEIKQNGNYDALINRWVNESDPSMPPIKRFSGGKVLRVGTTSDIGLPIVTKINDEWKGMDVELTLRFGEWLGREIQFVDMNFGSLIPSLATNKIDLIASSLMISEERKKQVNFSEPYYSSAVTLIQKNKETVPLATSGDAMFKSVDDLHDKRIGVVMGTIFDGLVASRYPNAKIYRFERSTDMLTSMQTGKIDAALYDAIGAKVVMRTNTDIGLLTDKFHSTPLGMGFNKNNTFYRDDYQRYINEIKADGTYDSIYKRWMENDPEKAVMPLYKNNSNGKSLKVAVAVADLPYVAMVNNEYVGFDIELIKSFAAKRNYNLSFTSMEFSSLIAALASGKVNMIADGISVNEERSKQIDFVEYATFQTAVLALNKNIMGQQNNLTDPPSKPGFIAKFKESFYNNIILENRYLMILNGLLVTLIISIFSSILGTIIGGGICFMRMSKNTGLNQTARIFISLVRGTPVLVLLMIIYYVVFASVDINAILVAVVAFGINFGAYVSEMFRTSIENVDRGQKEAGIASGFTKVQTFVHIIMPQALRQVLPVYKGEFISLVKMTSIVGYIAVEDLTKASDIIRSRTFDAFFPLIMAAVIYIALAWLLTISLDYIGVSIDPKKKRQSN